MAAAILKNSVLLDEHIECYNGLALYSYEEFLTDFYPDLTIQEGMVWATALDTWVTCKEYVTDLHSDAIWVSGQAKQSKMEALEAGIFNWYDKC